MDSETLVRAALSERPLTMGALVEHTGLARRTIYGVVQRLRDAGILKEQVSLRDARQTFFWLPHQG